MTVPIQLHSTDPFAKYIRLSFFAHLIFAALLIFRAVLFPSEPILIQRAIRVDMVGLPPKSQAITSLPAPPQPAPKAVDKPAEPKPAPAPIAKKELPIVKKLEPEKIDLRKTKRAEEDAFKRLAAFQKLAEMSKSRAKNEAKPQPVRGDVLAAGSSITGLNKIDYDDYLEKLDDKLKSNWNLPSLLKNRNYKATVVVFVDSNGNILKKEVKKSSGNQVFDEKCLEAVDRSAPFDAPPLKLRNILQVDGIEFGFPE
jgi:TonB family protein